MRVGHDYIRAGGEGQSNPSLCQTQYVEPLQSLRLM